MTRPSGLAMVKRRRRRDRAYIIYLVASLYAESSPHGFGARVGLLCRDPVGRIPDGQATLRHGPRTRGSNSFRGVNATSHYHQLMGRILV